MATVAESRAVRPLPLRWRRGLFGELWAEFFGTFILLCFGDGVVAMLWALIGSGRTISTKTSLLGSGDWLLITWGWCLAVVFAIYVVGGVTGAHINPAITLGVALRKQMPWRKVPSYWVAQTLGAFVGAALVFLVYNNAINHYDQINHIVKGTAASLPTYSTFATFPAPYFHNVLGPLIDQIVGTFFLALFVFAVTDEFNQPPESNMAPWIVGFIVMAVGLSFGANAGLRDQPRPRLRAADLRLDRRLGQGGLPRGLRQHKHLLLDTDRRASRRRRDRGADLQLLRPGHPDGPKGAGAWGRRFRRDRAGHAAWSTGGRS